MKLKKLLQKYNIFYDIYQHSDNAEIKNHLINNKTLYKNMDFYHVECSKDERQWKSGIFLSLGEATAYEAHLTHKKYIKKNTFILESQIKTKIISINFEDIIFDDELLDDFISRIKYLVPYDKVELENMPEDMKDIQTFWNFEHHLESHYIFYKNGEFLFSTHEDAELYSSIDYGENVVIDDNGQFGLIRNKTKLLGGEPEFEIVFECEYYYIECDDSLAQMQKEYIQTDDYKSYFFDIVDTDTKEVYSTKSLCNSLDSDNFLSIDENGFFEYNYLSEEKKIIKSKKYKQIINPIRYALKPSLDNKANLWGYINNKCEEIISPKFKNYGFFNDGFAVIKEDNKSFVIDELGDIVIASEYDEIVHYEYELFFVRDDTKWAVFKKDKIYIDFFNEKDELENIKKENNLKDDELLEFLNRKYFRSSGGYFASTENEIFILLRLKILEKKYNLQKQKYDTSLEKYIQLFDTFTSQKDLSEAGLLGMEVIVSDCEITTKYKDIIKDKSKGTIGWEYPSSAGMFDMKKELPVQFIKKDGNILTLGIEKKYLKLKNKVDETKTNNIIIKPVNVGLIILFILSFVWWCCGYNYYYDNLLIKSEQYPKYKELQLEYKSNCESWEYNKLYHPFVINNILKLKDKNNNLELPYDATQTEKRYKQKLKYSIDVFEAQNIYTTKIYNFQANYKESQDAKTVKNKDLIQLKDVVQSCKNVKHIAYFIPTLIDENKKISDKFELLEISMVDINLEELDIKKAKRGYELLFDYMYKNYTYYLDEIEYKLEDYNDFLYAFGFDRVKELDRLKTILNKSSYMDIRDKYWQKRYYDKIQKIQSTKINKYKYFYKWDAVYKKQKLLLHSYLKKLPNKSIKEVPAEVLKIAEDFIMFSSVTISTFGDVYQLGFVKGKLKYIGHAYMGKYKDTNVKTIQNTNYYIKNDSIYEFDADISKYFKKKKSKK
jgi:hypothetical protein